MLALGNFTALGFRLAVYMLASLLVGMCLREYVRSRAATSLGDPTPRLWGRLSWKPASWFDPFGSGVLPALIAILWMVQTLLIPAAYGKPAPIDPSRFRRHVRDVIIVSTAGPIATLALGIARRAHRAGHRTLRRDVPDHADALLHEHVPHGLPPLADPGTRWSEDAGIGAPTRRRLGLSQLRPVPPARACS